MEMNGFEDVRARLAAWKGSFPAFARALDREGVRTLSWSKVAAVEFCETRYLLEFVQRLRLVPRPFYFVKGEVFHIAAARIYRDLAAGRRPSLARLDRFVDSRLDDDRPHLKNALRLALDNVRPDHEVLSVEAPFVLDLGPKLPPALGIADLVLRRGPDHVVVDHKTGTRFGDHDELQLVLYREWARREFGAERCAVCYDEYRWVNNLEKIRKPAFQRTEVRPGPQAWRRALDRIGEADEAMRRIERDRDGDAGGECFRCPWKEQCPSASSAPGFFY
jgi:hypothetical protein